MVVLIIHAASCISTCSTVGLYACRLQKDVYYDYDLEDEMKRHDDEKRKQKTRQSQYTSSTLQTHCSHYITTI